MTKPVKAAEAGLKPHFKVQVVLPGAVLHFACWTEPEIHAVCADSGLPSSPCREQCTAARCTPDLLEHEWTSDWIDDPAYGCDVLGFVEWSAVQAVTWRWSE